MTETVGTRLRKRREELHYTQNSLEETAGLSRGVISAFETDKKYPKDIEIYGRLAAILQVHLYSLLPPQMMEILSDNKADEAYRALCERIQTPEQLEGLQQILDGVKKFNSSS